MQNGHEDGEHSEDGRRDALSGRPGAQLSPLEGQVAGVEELEALYREPSEGVRLKSVDIIDEGAARLIAASPFLVLATTSANGLDCSPKGGVPGFVQVQDAQTLLLPDWSGNNRLDGLRNILTDPRVGLVFFYPGRNEVFRVNGTARLSSAPALTFRFQESDRHPRIVIVITVSEAFIHCGRAITFGRLWDEDARIGPDEMPDTGAIIRAHIQYSRTKQGEQR